MGRAAVVFAIAAALTLPGRASAASLFLIDGRGWGHGVGMGQWGAEGYAVHGWKHEQILAHYYPATSLGGVGAQTVRVLIAEGRPRVRIASSMPYVVRDARGHVRHARGGFVVTPKRRLPLTFVPGAAPLTLDGAGYRGELTIRRGPGGLTVINTLPLERYLRGVVPDEMPKSWHPEAYQAQAIAARSYAISQLSPSRPYDFTADAAAQVYGGIHAERPETNLAVGATAGQVLTWHGRVITAYYHSSSGGRTAAVQDVWPDKTPRPYLVSVSDPYDSISPYHRWGPFVTTQTQLGEKLGAPHLEDVVVESNPSGVADRVRIVGSSTSRVVTGESFAQLLGLRSRTFAVRVLSLDAPTRSAVHDRPFSLGGFVRGLAGVRLEEQSRTGAWRTVTQIRPRLDGRFEALIRPRRTTAYRLALADAAGPAVVVRVRRI